MRTSKIAQSRYTDKLIRNVVVMKLRFETLKNLNIPNISREIIPGVVHTVNPNTFVGLVGKVRKKHLPKKEGRVEKKARAVHPAGPGLEPGTCRVLGEGPQLHARGAV